MPEVIINENGREMTVFYPKSEDKGEEEALREYAIEKTREDLRKQPTKPPPTKSKEEIGSALKEFVQWRNERKEREQNHQNTRKYY